jgi:hypothetical protein
MALYTRQDSRRLVLALGKIKVITSTIWGATVLIIIMGRIYDACHWDDLRWHDICIPSYMKFDTGVQAILRLGLNNLKGCNVGITDRKDLLCTPLNWAQVAGYTYQFSWRSIMHLSNVMAITAKIWEPVMLVINIEGIYEVCRWDGFILHDIRIKLSSFMKMGTGVQAILRFSLRNIKGCNSGITDGRDVWSTPLRWNQVSRFMKISSSIWKLIGGYRHRQ